MTLRDYLTRRARVAAGRCPRCNRPVDPWPLKRPDVCTPADWHVCGRQWDHINAAEERIKVTVRERIT